MASVTNTAQHGTGAEPHPQRPVSTSPPNPLFQFGSRISTSAEGWRNALNSLDGLRTRVSQGTPPAASALPDQNGNFAPIAESSLEE